MSDRKSPTSILIIDDHPLTANGIREVLEREFGKISIEICQNGQSGLERIWAHSFSLVLLDLSLGTRSGLEVLEDIKKHDPRLPVLIVSMCPEEIYAVRGLRAGAAGYLRKDAPVAEMLNAVHKVLAGSKYISEGVAQNLASYLTSPRDKPTHERLSRREFEVLCLIGEGIPMKQIAAQLGISVKTVSTYRSRILLELGLDSTAALIKYCLDQRLGLVRT